jgi:hypothetical protein
VRAIVKSYFLEGLIDEQSARIELSKALPNQVEPWLLNSQSGDPIAYFYIADDKDGVRCIQADVSGRHSDHDSAVLDLLRELQRQLGGTVRDDT